MSETGGGKVVRTGFDAVNIQDSHHLRNALINCDDPIKAISDFQEENSILLPTLKPAMNLLDLHGVKRVEFHLSVVDELRDQLTKRVEELAASINQSLAASAKDSGKDHHHHHHQQQQQQQQQQQLTAANCNEVRKLEELLDKSFPLIAVPRLTSLVLLIMKSLPNINEAYLSYLKNNENFYSLTSIEVKRQIWSKYNDIFLKELTPHFDKFIGYIDDVIKGVDHHAVGQSGGGSGAPIVQPLTFAHISNIEVPVIKESLLVTNTTYTHLIRVHKRHLVGLVTDVAKLIGSNNAKLYRLCVGHLLSKYLKTHDWFYSTFKTMLSTKLTEPDGPTSTTAAITPAILLETLDGGGAGGVECATSLHKFACIMNACLKEKKIDAKKAKELEAIMDSKHYERIFTDVVFILADPFVVDLLARNVISLLNRCIQNETLPRNCSELVFLMRLLSLSLLSWEILDSESKQEPKMDLNVITQFLPNLAYFTTDFYDKLYDDSMTALSNAKSATAASLLVNSSPTPISAIAALTSLTPAAATTPTSGGGGNALAAAADAANKKSPPIVLKISTRKIEIITSIKAFVSENETCAALLAYFVLACIELADWTNVKVLVGALAFPKNNEAAFEKLFVYQLFHIVLSEKTLVEQFKHDWFVSLMFDDFLVPMINQKDEQASKSTAAAANTENSSLLIEQVYKLLDRIFPVHLSSINFIRLLELLKPKKMYTSSLHIVYLKLKSKVESASNNGNEMD